MSALGAAGNASLAGLTAAESESQKNESQSMRTADREVVEWTGNKRRKISGRALQNRKVKEIIGRLERNRWKISNGPHRSGTVSIYGGMEYDFGVLSFESVAESESQAAILWKRYKTGEWEVKGYVYSNSSENSENEGIITVDSEMNAQKKEYEEGVTIESPCPCLDPGGGGDCVYFHDEYCDDFNLSCILWLIAQIGIGCGTAGPIGCLAGASVSVAPYLTGDGCNVCDEYSEEEEMLC